MGIFDGYITDFVTEKYVPDISESIYYLNSFKSLNTIV